MCVCVCMCINKNGIAFMRLILMHIYILQRQKHNQLDNRLNWMNIFCGFLSILSVLCRISTDNAVCWKVFSFFIRMCSLVSNMSTDNVHPLIIRLNKNKHRIYALTVHWLEFDCDRQK